MDRYEIVYNYEDEYDIFEYFDGSWLELQEYLKQMRRNGCYNISATYVYSYNETLMD